MHPNGRETETKSKGDTDWRDLTRKLYDHGKKKIVAYVIEAAIHVIMSTHIYKFVSPGMIDAHLNTPSQSNTPCAILPHSEKVLGIERSLTREHNSSIGTVTPLSPVIEHDSSWAALPEMSISLLYMAGLK